MIEHVIRLLPGQDFILSLEQYLRKHHIKAAYIGTCVGSFERVVFRKSSEKTLFTLDGPFEIVSVEGTLSNKGIHVHLAVSDRHFKVYGGHVLPGTVVRHTAEIVLIELEHHELSREKSHLTGYKELQVRYTAKCSDK